MDRKDAITLLQELVKQEVIHPILLSLERNSNEGYDLIINQDLGNNGIEAIKRVIAEKNLSLFEDKSRGCYRIRISTYSETQTPSPAKL